MKIESKIEYPITSMRYFEREFDIKELTEYILLIRENYRIFTKTLLRDVILDFSYEIFDNFSDDMLILKGDNLDDIDINSFEFNILNIDELTEYYSYLTKELEESCCDNETGNYCSNCGKKLK